MILLTLKLWWKYRHQGTTKWLKNQLISTTLRKRFLLMIQLLSTPTVLNNRHKCHSSDSNREVIASYQHRVIELLSTEVGSRTARWMQAQINKLVPNYRWTTWYSVTRWRALLNSVWRQLQNTNDIWLKLTGRSTIRTSNNGKSNSIPEVKKVKVTKFHDIDVGTDSVSRWSVT